ncbi:hypothetical protein GALL_475820 [mine drainage metagenome]|uniref:Uncharacterized protein n=1 Tax=mine drainage metagenome TaxID=410659 RepID=A0A1J5PHW3_9ZZZZ
MRPHEGRPALGDADRGAIAKRLRDDLRGGVIGRRHEDLHGARPEKGRDLVGAIDGLKARNGLRDDEKAAAVAPHRLQRLDDDRHPTELVELVEQEEDLVGLVGTRLVRLELRKRGPDEQAHQWRDRLQLQRRNRNIERLREFAEGRKVKVASSGGIANGRGVPGREPRTANHVKVAVKDGAALGGEGRKNLRHALVLGGRGILRIGLRLVANEEEIMGMPKRGLALLDRIEAGRREQGLALPEEPLDPRVVHRQKDVDQRLNGVVAMAGVFQGGDRGQRIERMAAVLAVIGREIPDCLFQALLAPGRGERMVFSFDVENDGTALEHEEIGQDHAHTLPRPGRRDHDGMRKRARGRCHKLAPELTEEERRRREAIYTGEIFAPTNLPRRLKMRIVQLGERNPTGPAHRQHRRE